MTAETAPNGDRVVGAFGNCLPSMDIPVGLGQVLLADNTTITWTNRSGVPLRVIRVDTCITVVPATGDAILTIENGDDETIGSITITESGSAVGDVDTTGLISQTLAYSPIIAVDETLGIDCDATASAGEATVTAWLRPCIDGVS